MKIEGKNPVREIISSGATVEKLIVENGNKDSAVREIISLAREKKIKVEFIDKRGLDKISETGHHQGVIAEYTDFKYADLDELIRDASDKGSEMLFSTRAMIINIAAMDIRFTTLKSLSVVSIMSFMQGASPMSMPLLSCFFFFLFSLFI